MQRRSIFLVLGAVLCIGLQDAARSQTFQKQTDPANPIVTTQTNTNYAGPAWIDFDGDGDLDLFGSNTYLFRNDAPGGSGFSRVSVDFLGGKIQTGISAGISWGDYDNDGDPDVMIAGNPALLNRNEGEDRFSIVQSKDIGPGLPDLPFDDTRGWAAAWADCNNDGNLDLLITHAAGFHGTPLPCHFFLGDGDRLIRQQGYEFTSITAPYTVASWADYDMDGDQDLFIASGPAGSAARDYLYKNLLKENGTLGFERITDGPLGTDLQDGQLYNFIDYDNDGDLDIFLTNYNGAPDRLYRNDGGTYVNASGVLAAQGGHLANNWADFENDGDQDLIITSEAGTTAFLNNGDGSFSPYSSDFTASGATRGASFGDYDQDGDLDLYVMGSGQGQGLFKNTTENANHWVQFDLEGIVSNRSALGALVKVKATIGGQPVWQMRVVSSQNSFGGHDTYRVHIGLGDATLIDSVLIQWPSGQSSAVGGIAVDTLHRLLEPVPSGFLRANFSASSTTGEDTLTVSFRDLSVTDPAIPVTSWEWDLDGDGVADATSPTAQYFYAVSGDTSFDVTLTVSNGGSPQSLTRTAYITMAGPFPRTTVATSELNLGTLDVNAGRFDTSFVVSNTGSGSDSVDVSLIYGNISIDSALAVAPAQFALTPGGSQVVTFSVFPGRVNRNALDLYSPRIVVRSRFNKDTNEFVRQVRFRITGTATSAEETGGIPSVYRLDQNYPNPFNPSTTITYGLAERARVSLQLFDALGRQVVTLAQGMQEAGTYTVQVEAGRLGLASGIYWYRLSAGAFTAVRSMVLIQ